MDLDENMKKSGSFVKNLFAYFTATVYLRLASFQQVSMLAEHERYIFVREVESRQAQKVTTGSKNPDQTSHTPSSIETIIFNKC